jgi:hypothetical protein
MNCIGGGYVWCSRTYNFAISTVFAYNAATTTWTAGINTVSSSQATTWTNVTATDQGSCCDTAANFIKASGATAVAAATA